jgi:hypothetical protein
MNPFIRPARCESAACVEVSTVGDEVTVRSSRDPDRTVVFDREEWSAFTAGLLPAAEPSARFAISPDEHQVAIRGYRGDSWFVAKFDEVKGGHHSEIPADWAYYVPATTRDRLADELLEVRDLFATAGSVLAALEQIATADHG